MKANESTQDESDFTKMRNERKRIRKHVPTPINNVRSMVVSIDPKLPAVKINQIRELNEEQC